MFEENVNVPGGRYWEPGCEEEHILPEAEWTDEELDELPFL